MATFCIQVPIRDTTCPLKYRRKLRCDRARTKLGQAIESESRRAAAHENNKTPQARAVRGFSWRLGASRHCSTLLRSGRVLGDRSWSYF